MRVCVYVHMWDIGGVNVGEIMSTLIKHAIIDNESIFNDNLIIKRFIINY